MIRKQGKNSWQIVIYLGRDPKTGKERRYAETYYAPTKSLAQAREAELKRQFQRLGTRQPFMTLGEWLDGWLEEAKSTVSNATWRSYASYIKLLKPIVGTMPLQTLSAEKLLPVRKRIAHLSARTQKNIIATLKTAVRAAIDAKLAPADALVGFKNVRAPKRERRVLTREEMLKLIQAAGKYKHGLIIRLLVVTGARIGEILGLTWDMIDFKKKTITIDQAVDVQARKLKAETKTENSRRTIELDEETVRLLAEHKKQQAGQKVQAIRKEKSLVFQAEEGKPVKYSAVHDTLHRALREAGLPHIRIHDIRHSVVTFLLTEGVPPILVAALVGHNVNTTTITYAQQIRKMKSLLILS